MAWEVCSGLFSERQLSRLGQNGRPVGQHQQSFPDDHLPWQITSTSSRYVQNAHFLPLDYMLFVVLFFKASAVTRKDGLW